MEKVGLGMWVQKWPFMPHITSRGGRIDEL